MSYNNKQKNATKLILQLAEISVFPIGKAR